MARYVYRNGEVVDAATAGPKHESSAATHVISDTMSETKHMADGRVYTSKSEFRKATKAAGCVEVGHDPALLRPRKALQLDRGSRRDAIRRSIYELKNGIRHE